MSFPLDAGAWLFSGMAMQDYRTRQLKEEMLQELERRQPAYHHWEGQGRDLGGEGPGTVAHAAEMLLRELSRVNNKNGKGAFTTDDGTTYEGDLKDGKPHGRGIARFPDGEKIECDWKNGKAHGTGIQTFPDGTEYVGAFREGHRQGQGAMLLLGGTRYTGEFKDDKPNGYGSLTDSDGFEYIGGIKEGLPHGKGTATLPKGTFVGKFKNGVRHGRSILTIPGVGSVENVYHNNILEKGGVLTLQDGQRIELDENGRPMKNGHDSNGSNKERDETEQQI